MLYIKVIFTALAIFCSLRFGSFWYYVLLACFIIIYILDKAIMDNNYILCFGTQDKCEIECATNYLYWTNKMQKHFCSS